MKDSQAFPEHFGITPEDPLEALKKKSPELAAIIEKNYPKDTKGPSPKKENSSREGEELQRLFKAGKLGRHPGRNIEKTQGPEDD